MNWNSHIATLSTAYIVTGCLTLAAIILSALICKLLNATCAIFKKNDAAKQSMPFLLVTALAIGCFLVSILLIIGVIVQLILIDGHKLHSNHGVDTFYYEFFEEMEYGITIFDSIGHLLMIWLFISRLKLCFESSAFGFPKHVICYIHVALFILTLSSLVIIFEIVRDSHDVYVIITSEIIWEVAIECTCLWLLWLFCSKLYELIKFTLATSIARAHKKGVQSNMDVLSEVISHNSPKLHHHSSANPSSKQSDGTYMDRMSPEPPSVTQQAMIIHDHQLNSDTAANIEQHAHIMDFVNLMTKVTLLVVISVFSSFLSLIGNVFIEIHELQTIEKHTADIASMWAFLLPVTDMIITSFMLFLQFPSSAAIYNKMCYKPDVWFLTLCLKMHAFVSKRSDSDKDSISVATVTSTGSQMLSRKEVTLEATSDAQSTHIEIPTLSPESSNQSQSPAYKYPSMEIQ